MVSRTAFEQLNHSLILVLLSFLGLFIVYVLPCLELIYSLQNFELNQLSTLLFTINIISISMMLFTFLPTVKFYKIAKFFVFTLPLSTLIFGCMTLSSAINYYLFDAAINGKVPMYSKNEMFHCWIPTPGVMSKVHTCFQQLAHCKCSRSHSLTPSPVKPP